MALTIWDQASGASRECSQEDIDIMQAKVNGFGRMIALFKENSDRVFTEIAEIQARYRTSAQLSGDLDG